MYTKEQILSALSNVEEPDLKKDLVTLNMIEDVEISGNEVRFSVILTTPACPLKAMIEKAIDDHKITRDDYDEIINIASLEKYMI